MTGEGDASSRSYGDRFFWHVGSAPAPRPVSCWRRRWSWRRRMRACTSSSPSPRPPCGGRYDRRRVRRNPLNLVELEKHMHRGDVKMNPGWQGCEEQAPRQCQCPPLARLSKCIELQPASWLSILVVDVDRLQLRRTPLCTRLYSRLVNTVRCRQ